MHLDTTQQEIAGALKDNAVLLAEVGATSTRRGGGGPCPTPPLTPFPTPPPRQVQKTMKENLVVVEDNFADIDARIKRLQK